MCLSVLGLRALGVFGLRLDSLGNCELGLGCRI